MLVKLYAMPRLRISALPERPLRQGAGSQRGHSYVAKDVPVPIARQPLPARLEVVVEFTLVGQILQVMRGVNLKRDLKEKLGWRFKK